jgi:hypothetical protein
MTAVKLASPESVGELVPGDWGDVLMNTSEEIDFCRLDDTALLTLREHMRGKV